TFGHARAKLGEYFGADFGCMVEAKSDAIGKRLFGDDFCAGRLVLTPNDFSNQLEMIGVLDFKHDLKIGGASFGDAEIELFFLEIAQHRSAVDDPFLAILHRDANLDVGTAQMNRQTQTSVFSFACGE